jgi:hypothetical protein
MRPRATHSVSFSRRGGPPGAPALRRIPNAPAAGCRARSDLPSPAGTRDELSSASRALQVRFAAHNWPRAATWLVGHFLVHRRRVARSLRGRSARRGREVMRGPCRPNPLRRERCAVRAALSSERGRLPRSRRRAGAPCSPWSSEPSEGASEAREAARDGPAAVAIPSRGQALAAAAARSRTP